MKFIFFYEPKRAKSIEKKVRTENYIYVSFFFVTLSALLPHCNIAAEDEGEMCVCVCAWLIFLQLDWNRFSNEAIESCMCVRKIL